MSKQISDHQVPQASNLRPVLFLIGSRMPETYIEKSFKDQMNNGAINGTWVETKYFQTGQELFEVIKDFADKAKQSAHTPLIINNMHGSAKISNNKGDNAHVVEVSYDLFLGSAELYAMFSTAFGKKAIEFMSVSCQDGYKKDFVHLLPLGSKQLILSDDTTNVIVTREDNKFAHPVDFANDLDKILVDMYANKDSVSYFHISESGIYKEKSIRELISPEMTQNLSDRMNAYLQEYKISKQEFESCSSVLQKYMATKHPSFQSNHSQSFLEYNEAIIMMKLQFGNKLATKVDFMGQLKKLQDENQKRINDLEQKYQVEQDKVVHDIENFKTFMNANSTSEDSTEVLECLKKLYMALRCNVYYNKLKIRAANLFNNLSQEDQELVQKVSYDKQQTAKGAKDGLTEPTKQDMKLEEMIYTKRDFEKLFAEIHKDFPHDIESICHELNSLALLFRFQNGASQNVDHISFAKYLDFISSNLLTEQDFNKYAHLSLTLSYYQYIDNIRTEVRLYNDDRNAAREIVYKKYEKCEAQKIEIQNEYTKRQVEKSDQHRKLVNECEEQAYEARAAFDNLLKEFSEQMQAESLRYLQKYVEYDKESQKALDEYRVTNDDAVLTERSKVASQRKEGLGLEHKKYIDVIESQRAARILENKTKVTQISAKLKAINEDYYVEIKKLDDEYKAQLGNFTNMYDEKQLELRQIDEQYIGKAKKKYASEGNKLDIMKAKFVDAQKSAYDQWKEQKDIPITHNKELINFLAKTMQGTSVYGDAWKQNLDMYLDDEIETTDLMPFFGEETIEQNYDVDFTGLQPFGWGL